MEIKEKRIGELAFMHASYLCEAPEHPSWDIVMYYPNSYYGRDNEYPEDPNDSNFRIYPDIPHCRVHKSCFKHKECNFVIAEFNYDSHESFYEVRFISDRPIEYLNTVELRETFAELLRYGNEQLNNRKEETEEEY